MHYYPLRNVPVPGAAGASYDEWLQALDQELEREDCDRNELCRKILTDIYYPDLVGRDPESLTPSTRIALLQMDPRNVTLEPEYYQEIDEERYARVKPLIWLWEMFDKSPLGENVHLGIQFRRILARRIFKRCGKNFKAFHFVKFSFGYNLEVGDDVVVHRHVLLDDRGGIRIGNRASISDFANIYSHTHDIVDPKLVATPSHRPGRRRPDHLSRHRPGRGPCGTRLHGRGHGPGHPRHRAVHGPCRDPGQAGEGQARRPDPGARTWRPPGRRPVGPIPFLAPSPWTCRQLLPVPAAGPGKGSG
jgi:acetyltransferase-like isoleucine patch superfamily enzyme